MAKYLIYKKNIIKELFLHGSLSTIDLSSYIGKSLSLTTKIVTELLKEQVITESGFAPSSGGRRPLIYQLNPNSFYILAVAMDQFVSKITLLNSDRSFVIPIKEVELDLNQHTAPLAFLTDQIIEVLNNEQIEKSKVIGIGIGMPGFIDPDNGINHTFLGAGICDYIQSRTSLPVFIENDSSVIALAEYKFGSANGSRNAMVVNISWGIGLGMIIDNKLFRGENGFAGEFSHISLFKNGKLCTCGKIGCLETEASLTYMLATATEKIKNGKASYLKQSLLSLDSYELKSQKFIHAAQLGDSLVVEVISAAGYNIGRGIAILIHLLNPAKIILSGRCAAAGKIWLPPIQQALNEFCIPTLVNNTELEISTLNQDAQIIGAAVLVMEHIKPNSLEKIFGAIGKAAK